MAVKFFAKIFNRHKWQIDEEKSNASVNSYYTCKRTGDRKVRTNFNKVAIYKADEAIDKQWLEAGSGKYFVQGTFPSQPSYTVERPKP